MLSWEGRDQGSWGWNGSLFHAGDRAYEEGTTILVRVFLDNLTPFFSQSEFPTGKKTRCRVEGGVKSGKGGDRRFTEFCPRQRETPDVF